MNMHKLSINVIAGLIASLVAALTACSDSSDGGVKINDPVSLTMTTYNMGLALNLVPYSEERLLANSELMTGYDSDVLCLQEVWQEDDVATISAALSDNYPFIYTVPAEQAYTAEAACSSEEIEGFAACSANRCENLTGSDLVACATTQCAEFLPELSPPCFTGVAAGVGIPGITVEALVELVTQPAGKFAYEGSLGLILASKHTLRDRAFQDLIDDSSVNHRGALYAEITISNENYIIGCTHPSSNLNAVIPYPADGKHGSWEGENQFMQRQMIDYVNEKAGQQPIFFGGDFNCSIANDANGVDSDFPDSCQLWLSDGFVDPAAEQLPCSYCYSENLILMEQEGSDDTLLDHIFVKNLAAADSIVAERIFDDPVSIEALNPPAELQPEDSPAMTHPSDHFGVELELRIP